MTFSSRQDAGRKLGHYLAGMGLNPDLILGLPRGGVVVAAEVARLLHRSLDVLLVRKVGHPRFPEFAVGAIAEDGALHLDEQALRENQVNPAELQKVIREEQDRLRHYREKWHPHGSPSLKDKVVLLIDDGIATGATVAAAILCAQKSSPKSVMVAAPVASSHAIHRLRSAVDRVEVLLADEHFNAVGHYYDDFPQTEDDEVLDLLRENQKSD